MLAIALSTLFHLAPENPYHWHITCDRFAERSAEIMLDENLSVLQRQSLIGYLRTKLDRGCQTRTFS